MALSLPSLSLVYALLILVPGFLTYKLGRRWGKITVEIDRFDKAIYTVLGSGISLSIVVIAYSILTGQVVEDVLTTNRPVLELSLGYLLTTVVASALGIISGTVINNALHGNEDVRTETTWQMVSEGREEPARVRAVMRNGQEIWGEIQASDSEPHGQDLLLRYPLKVVRDEHGNVIKEKSIGEYVFLSQGEISQLYFETGVNI